LIDNQIAQKSVIHLRVVIFVEVLSVTWPCVWAFCSTHKCSRSGGLLAVNTLSPRSITKVGLRWLGNRQFNDRNYRRRDNALCTSNRWPGFRVSGFLSSVTRGGLNIICWNIYGHYRFSNHLTCYRFFPPYVCLLYFCCK